MKTNNYPTVNYIGNKEKVTEWIIDSLPISKGTVLDLFCGGCSVSYVLKEKGFKVISNDVLYSNYVLAKAIIENSIDILKIDDYENIRINNKEIEKKYELIRDTFENKIYFDYEVKELAYLSLVAKKLKDYKNYMFLALLRRAMIRKIPYSRMNVKWEEIQKFRDEVYSYAKYGRYRHYHNIPFSDHIEKNMDEYNKSVFDNGQQCYAYNLDGLDCVKKITQKVDLIYMDPPYPSTMNNYKDFYGAYDELVNKKTVIKTDLTDKLTFLDNFKKIVKACIGKTDYIAISLNNKCYPGVEKIIECIKPYILSFEVKTKEHVYKVTNKENKHTNYEILLICKMKEV